jgi:type IV pilus assembly protein PilV
MKPFTIRQLLRLERRYPQYPRQRGMALMESLVSILIFSFGVLGLIGLEASAINFSVDAEDRNRASLFANDVSSWMWLNGTVTVPAGQLSTWQTNIANTALGTGLPAGTLSITPTANTTNSADILIQWTPSTDKTSTTRQLTTRVIL